jgi:signal transduction histidine kinase
MGVIKPGKFTGEVTLLLDMPWLAMARCGKPTKLFRLSQDDFWRMLAGCHTIAREILQGAASKMRNIEGYSQQREKLAALGTMAAGLAQEAEARIEKAPKLDHLERSDREESVAKWLEGRGVPSAWELAPTFVSSDVDVVWLEQLTAKLPEASHADGLCWLEARLNMKLLLNQVEQSTTRIADLVKAIKSYSYMDQSPMQEVDIHEGLESTLTMLGHKLKNVTVRRAFDRSLPRIMAYGSELNQVWTNLIDNAIHAVNGTGKICIGTCLEDNQLVVEIVDNGPGIPPEVQSHIFEPFFTTKGVGAGTGLGLIISNRIVAERHGGEIEFESRPGETRFKVRLPVNRVQPAAPQLAVVEAAR